MVLFVYVPMCSRFILQYQNLYVASNDRAEMNDRWLQEDYEQISCRLIKVLSRYLPRRTA
jgi:hypothetical protein